MIDLKIDFENNNIIIENGDFVLVKDQDEIEQSLRIRLRMATGNWFLDNRLGVDYFGKIFVKPINTKAAEKELRRVITDTIGVTGINSYTQTLENRKLIVKFTVTTIYSKNITISENLSI